MLSFDSVMSERQWRVLSLLERLNRGEVTVGEVAASLKRSRRQVQRMRKRLASRGILGLEHGNAGRRPKHRTSEEVRERVVMLRRGKYDGFNDQHFTEKLAEVEGLRLSRETVRRILREAGLLSPRKRRPPKHRQRRERKAQAGQMILWDGSDARLARGARPAPVSDGCD